MGVLGLNWQPSGAEYASNPSNESGDLLQWLCHDDSTIYIIVIIIITGSYTLYNSPLITMNLVPLYPGDLHCTCDSIYS